jgi:DNA-binding phage protein
MTTTMEDTMDRPMTLDELAAALEGRDMIRVAADTGVHTNTLYKLRTKKGAPRYDTLVKLSEYLRAGVTR